MLKWRQECKYFFEIVISFSLDVYPGVELVGHNGSSSFNFLRTLHTVFHTACSNLHFHQQTTRVFFSPHPCQHVFLVLIMAILTGLRLYLIIVFSLCSSMLLPFVSLCCQFTKCWEEKDITSRYKFVKYNWKSH